MPEPTVEIPDRASFKASEVCELAQIPSYVLRSWEKEFPHLGIEARPGAPRAYRRSDVEQILKIKHLVFSEGLTLAGARRKLEEGAQPEEDPPLILPSTARDRVAKLRRDLRSLLEMLSNVPPPALASSGGMTPQPPGPPHVTPEGSWPPVRGEHERKDLPPEEEVLPLLEGVPDSPPKKGRRHRRGAKDGDVPKTNPMVE